MDRELLLRNLQPPKGRFDVILDTDTFNEIDDQYAIAYLLGKKQANVLALCAAPFLNEKSVSPADGMEKSYQEILNVLRIAGREDMIERTHRGSERYLPDEKTPVDSPAARTIVELAKAHSPENPLYIACIGCITNVASALLMEPAIHENIVIAWAAFNAPHWPDNHEFNLQQDVSAGRVVMDSGAPVVLLPAFDVVSHFVVSGAELDLWLRGKNKLCTYLVENTFREMDSCHGRIWSRIIWDVVTVAWLFNNEDRLMRARIAPAPIPQYDHHVSFDHRRHPHACVWTIHRDAILQDLVDTLTT